MDNTNKNPIFSIKNFRSFGEDGADFELAPITVLTGCNSAGKSSLVKALMLLSEMRQQPDRLYVPSLNLYKREYGLGSYDKIIHKEDTSHRIEISYKVWSNLLQDFVNVKRTFGTHKNDVLNDGHLRDLTIEKNNGDVFFDLRKYTTSWKEDEQLAESLRAEFERFTIASDYYMCLSYEIIYENAAKKMSDVKKKQKYIANKSRLEKIAKIVQDENINPEDFLIEDLKLWGNLVNTRDSEKEKYIKLLALNEEERKEFTNLHFPENELLVNFQGRVTEEVSSPWFLKNALYIDSSSAFIRRIYSIEDKDKMNSALRNFIEVGRIDVSLEDINATDASYYWTGTFLNHWIKRFGLGEFVKIVGDGEGGIKIYLVKNGKDRLLADEGYGVTQLVSLLLNIDISISHNRRAVGDNNSWEDLKNGYANAKGVFRTPYPHRIICVEEPENHLHPKFQSLLADMFVEAYQKYNIHFIIETHSEYLIRKLQVMVADKENALTSDDVTLNYVEKNEDGISHNRQIKILEDGRLSEPFGPGFYDEADTLAMELMKYKARKK